MLSHISSNSCSSSSEAAAMSRPSTNGSSSGSSNGAPGDTWAPLNRPSTASSESPPCGRHSSNSNDSSRSIAASSKRVREAARGTGGSMAGMTESVRELFENRIDATAPRPVKQVQFALGRGLVGERELEQRVQEQALV